MFCKLFDDRNPKGYKEINLDGTTIRVGVVPGQVKRNGQDFIMVVGEENCQVGDIVILRSFALALTEVEALETLEKILGQAVQNKQSLSCEGGVVQVQKL